MSRKRIRSGSDKGGLAGRSRRLNIAALVALFAAMALVAYAAASSGRRPETLSTESPASLRLYLTADERREVFSEVIRRHDRGARGHDACAQVAAQRGLDEETVRLVAREGILRGWPRD